MVMNEKTNKRQGYPGLEKLSLEELEELLRRYIDATDEPDMDYTKAILEVMESRSAEDPNYKPCDVEAGLKKFRENYMVKEPAYLHLFPSDDLPRGSP
jgi:hypothetical protein